MQQKSKQSAEAKALIKKSWTPERKEARRKALQSMWAKYKSENDAINELLKSSNVK